MEERTIPLHPVFLRPLAFLIIPKRFTQKRIQKKLLKILLWKKGRK
jgi:hypothetical protein